MSLPTPPLKKGWLKKQSRTGLVKNWQTRHFVLSAGRIYYFQEQSDRFPFGEGMKGEMSLVNASISQQSKKQSDKQIYVSGSNGEKSMFMEAESATIANDWIAAIKQHCQYATAASLSGDFEDSPIRRTSTTSGYVLTKPAPSSSNPRTNSYSGEMDVEQSRRGSNDSVDNGVVTSDSNAEQHLVTPKPAWVIKVLRTNGEKIFINLCEHPDIPSAAVSMGYNKWPFMVLTPVRTVVEEKDGGETPGDKKSEISIYDAVVNPSVIALGAKEPPAKDATCLRALRLLRKNFGEVLESEYKLPKITKKYKGEIQQVRLPNNIQNLVKTRGSMKLIVGLNNSVRRMSDQSASSPLSGNSATLLLGENRRPAPFNRQMSEPPPTNETNSRPGLNRTNTNSPLSKLFPHPDDPTRSPSLDGNSGMKFQRSMTEVPSQGAGGQQNTSPNSMAKFSRLPSMAKNIRASFSNRNNSVTGTNSTAPNSVDGSPFSSQSVQRRYIPYVVTRTTGTIAKQEPNKNAPGKVLGHGVKLFVMCRKVVSDSLQGEGLAWLKTSEGWVLEKVYSGSVTRVLIPSGHGQPTGAKIITTRFEDVGSTVNTSRMSTMSATNASNKRSSTSGWAMFNSGPPKDSYQTRFLIDIYYPENAVIKLSRTYDEIATMRHALMVFPDKVVADRATKAGDFPSVVDGSEELLQDVNELLYVIDGVETWLNKLLTTLAVDRCKCKAFVDFLTPKEQDYYLMELELMTNGGIGGNWNDGSSGVDF